ncbi:hypothetical protein EJ04DRAFT_564551 [Polyplosphaeria fusca]|uniref:Uncharacterized protein n=1 Tax=Polyplosphaeria fusca TaxID=682080 RepID=A0A9P4QZN0_9PLEO|nr:hypothetical protein EJ04DRAFT_564551 [Polyplosphaeria fusca]
MTSTSNLVPGDVHQTDKYTVEDLKKEKNKKLKEIEDDQKEVAETIAYFENVIKWAASPGNPDGTSLTFHPSHLDCIQRKIHRDKEKAILAVTDLYKHKLALCEANLERGEFTKASEARINELEHDIAKALEQLTSKEKDNEQLTQTLAQLQTELKLKAGASDKRIKELEEDKKQTKCTIETKEFAIKKLIKEQEVEKMRQEHDALYGPTALENSNLKDEVDALNQELSITQSQLSDARARIDELQAEVKKARSAPIHGNHTISHQEHLQRLNEGAAHQLASAEKAALATEQEIDGLEDRINEILEAMHLEEVTKYAALVRLRPNPDNLRQPFISLGQEPNEILQEQAAESRPVKIAESFPALPPPARRLTPPKKTPNLEFPKPGRRLAVAKWAHDVEFSKPAHAKAGHIRQDITYAAVATDQKPKITTIYNRPKKTKPRGHRLGRFAE